MLEVARMYDISKPALRSFLTMALKHSYTHGELLSLWNVIFLSYVDSAFLDMAENLHISMRKFGMNNCLYIAPNKATVNELKKRGMRGVALWEENDDDTKEASNHGTPEFGNKVIRKIPLGKLSEVCRSGKMPILTLFNCLSFLQNLFLSMQTKFGFQIKFYFV